MILMILCMFNIFVIRSITAASLCTAAIILKTLLERLSEKNYEFWHFSEKNATNYDSFSVCISHSNIFIWCILYTHMDINNTKMHDSSCANNGFLVYLANNLKDPKNPQMIYSYSDKFFLSKFMIKRWDEKWSCVERSLF